jgi:hypothetical protein
MISFVGRDTEPFNDSGRLLLESFNEATTYIQLHKMNSVSKDRTERLSV